MIRIKLIFLKRKGKSKYFKNTPDVRFNGDMYNFFLKIVKLTKFFENESDFNNTGCSSSAEGSQLVILGLERHPNGTFFEASLLNDATGASVRLTIVLVCFSNSF